MVKLLGDDDVPAAVGERRRQHESRLRSHARHQGAGLCVPKFQPVPRNSEYSGRIAGQRNVFGFRIELNVTHQRIGPQIPQGHSTRDALPRRTCNGQSAVNAEFDVHLVGA